jgi:hypothetical protein
MAVSAGFLNFSIILQHTIKMVQLPETVGENYSACLFITTRMQDSKQ